MSAADGLLILVRSGAVLALAGIGMALARRNPVLGVAAARYGLLGALLVSLATPWVSEQTRPMVSVADAFPVLSLPTSPPAQPLSTVKVAATPMPTNEGVGKGFSTTAAVEVAREPFNLRRIFLSLWAVGAGILALQLLCGWAGLRRVRGSCHPAALPALQARVATLAAEVGIRAPIVLEGEAIAGPCVAGVRRTTVMLPKGWAERTDEETVDAVLRHELAHVANGDLRWGLFGRIARILLWPQPLVWILRRPAAAAEEEACDRQVLAAGVPQARYAAGLLALREGRRADRVPGLAIGAVSRRSGFGRRIEAILAFSGRGGARLSRRAGLAVRGSALALALGTAFAFAHPAQRVDSTAGWVKGPYEGAVDLVDDVGAYVGVEKAWIVIRGHGSTPTVLTPSVLGSAIRLPGGQAEGGSTGVLAVRAKAAGHGLTFVKLWPAPTQIHRVRAVPAASLTGRLLLPDGRPAAGLRVTVPLLVRSGKNGAGTVFLQTRGVPSLLPSVVTDPNGAFRIDGLPPETNVRYDVDDLRYASLEFGSQAATGKSGVIAAKPVRLMAAGRIAGRVTRGGRPVMGVKIAAQTNTNLGSYELGDWGEAFTDADGRYAIERLGPTVFNVAADLSNGLDRDVTTRARKAIDLKGGVRVENVDFDLEPGTLIEGSVTLPDGKPVASTEVGVYGPAHPESGAWVQSSKTDAQGRYRLRVPAGRQLVYLMDSRYELEHQHVTTSEGTPLRLDLKVTGFKPEEVAAEAAEVAVPAKAAREAPTGPTASFGPGKPFYGPIKLPNGATVRLAYVQDGSTGNPVWSPDGGPAKAADRARALDLRGFGTERPREKSRRIFLRVDVDGPPLGEYDAVLAVPQPIGQTVWQGYGDQYGRTLDMAGFRAKKTLRVTDMRFGVAAGPYRTATPAELGGGLLLTRIIDGPAKPPATLVGKATVTLTVAFPKALEGKNVRLAVLTKAGKRLELASWQDETEKNPKTGMGTRTYGFSGGASSDIARFELQTRNYRWATFRGIRLYPNP